MNEKEENIQEFINRQEELVASIKNNIVHIANQQKKLFESIESLYEDSPIYNLLDTGRVSEKLNAIMDELMGFYDIDWD